MAKKTVAQRLGRILPKIIRQNGRSAEMPEYGSWLLGRGSEDQLRRRVRIQVMLTVTIAVANLNGIGVAVLLMTVAFPVPSVFTDAPLWVTFAVAPAYIVLALALGAYWKTRRTVRALRWAFEGRRPSQTDARNTVLAPLRIAIITLILWGLGAALMTTFYGMANSQFVPQVSFSVGFCGILVATSDYLFSEFALRPVAAQALELGCPPRRFASGIMGRTITVWLLGSGIPFVGIALAAIFALSLWDLTTAQLAVAVLILSTAALIFGSVLMLLLAWLTVAPVQGVRAALKRIEQGDLRSDLVVFDATELGELQSGFNSMVHGLREREHVRDLFGRHVGREVAAAAEREPPKLGGEERHVAVVFVDIVGSTQLVTSRPAADVVQLLNRFFEVIVDEVDRHHGFVNKFEGDASLAVFGVPNRLECPEDEALASARAIARRLNSEVPECQAGIGVSAGQVVAGNVGAKQRFEYTTIGAPVNEAARLCELAKSWPARLLASMETVNRASEYERAHWSLGEIVMLRGRCQPTELATPVDVLDVPGP